MAHITGGGITDNLPRMLPARHVRPMSTRRWAVPPLFRWLPERGDDRRRTTMRRTFNMGIGLIVGRRARTTPSALIGELAMRGGRDARVIGIGERSSPAQPAVGDVCRTMP